MSTTEDLVLWCGSVRTKSLEDRLCAAESGGFSSISLFPSDVAGIANGNDTETLSLLKSSAVDVTVFDPFAKWLPDRYWNPP